MTHYMIELTQTYLGNVIDNASLSEQVALQPCLEVYLTQTDNCKGRIHTRSTSGKEVGIAKNREWLLREGDVFATERGGLVLVHLQAQKVMVLSFAESAIAHPIDLVHLGHVLGNHHWPILVRDGKLYLQLTIDEEVMEATIHAFKIPGLEIDYQWRALHEQFTFSEHVHRY